VAEHARLSLVTTDPARLADAVSYIELEARPVVERTPGNRGLSLVVDDELGVAAVTSYWVSGDAMRASERSIAPMREEVVRRGAGTVTVERYQVASTHRLGRPAAGAGVRLTDLEIDLRRVDDAVAAYEDTALPWLSECTGFTSASLLVHRATGRALDETVWEDADALAGSRSTAAAVRADAVAASDALVRGLAERRLAFSSTPLL
jgi:hypothetical protein